MRLAQGGEIDRARPLGFSFDGRRLEGFAGDTLASALLANGVRVVGRSFKYRRPRGIVSAGIEEPNAILDLRHGQRHDPNARATTEDLAVGMMLASLHDGGSAALDRSGLLDRLHRFIPAGFYYKTFMWPDWHRFEPAIRAMTGLGRLAVDDHGAARAEQHDSVDLAIVGAGPAGLAAALAATGRVALLDHDRRIGGSLLFRDATIGGEPAARWLAEAEATLARRGVMRLTRTLAFGLYDHNLLGAIERTERGDRLRLLRARRILLATGAIERPLLFPDNDRPGVMLASAALSYLRRHAVRVGAEVVIATANDSTDELADALRGAGSRVTVLDQRRGETIAEVAGRRSVEAVVTAAGQRIPADCLLVSGGFTPTLHLLAQAKGKTVWSETVGAPVPASDQPHLAVVGAAAGEFDLDAALAAGWRSGGGADGKAPQSGLAARQWSSPPLMPEARRRSRIFVDLQNDVTAGDIALAVRENYVSPEHLKRYTTLGMATDQGKTSGINGLAVLASETGTPLRELAATTYRPPFAPVSLAAIAGSRMGPLHSPIRRLALEAEHRAEGAYFRDYGILRPAWYGADAAHVAQECRAARTAAVVFDASPLGKIEVMGPEAEALVGFMFYTPMASLKPGRLRYGFMLTEGGAVYDDAVVARLEADRFVISCSSSHVQAVYRHLEEWRQERFDLARVVIHDATAHWATIAISGPRSAALVGALGFDASLAHMAMSPARFADAPARIARVSFTGERSYEISLPASRAGDLWRAARRAGATPMGVEALLVLRAEKGYILAGVDTDGETMPQDLGFGQPRATRRDSYIGDLALALPVAAKPGRKQLTGVAFDELCPAGAHALSEGRSIGLVTTSVMSETLGAPVALGLIADARRRQGERLTFYHLGRRHKGVLVPPCRFDPNGERLHA